MLTELLPLNLIAAVAVVVMITRNVTSTSIKKIQINRRKVEHPWVSLERKLLIGEQALCLKE